MKCILDTPHRSIALSYGLLIYGLNSNISNLSSPKELDIDLHSSSGLGMVHRRWEI